MKHKRIIILTTSIFWGILFASVLSLWLYGLPWHDVFNYSVTLMITIITFAGVNVLLVFLCVMICNTFKK